MFQQITLPYIIISAMLTLIIIIHSMWFSSETNKCVKILIIGSVILFFLIFTNHAIHIAKENNKKMVTQEDIINISKNNNFLNTNNNAFKLLFKILEHPIFYIAI